MSETARSPPPPRPGAHQPPLDIGSSLVMGFIGSVSRLFVYGLNSIHVTGLDRFLEILDKRQDVNQRERGLITVSNHISIIDDPLMWGVLPFRYHFDPSNHRWGLGAHDICFKNKFLGSFFFYGHVLPTHRYNYSPHGGLFQPTISEAIRLLSSPPSIHGDGAISPHPKQQQNATVPDIPDPFTNNGAWPGLPTHFTTNGTDSWPSPTAINPTTNRRAWVHIFPEACVHQHPRLLLRYFKWGVARLILESDPLPDVLPIFIDGTQRVMPEDRGFPRFVPRAGQSLRVAFGEPVDAEVVFGDLRKKWKDLVQKEEEEQLKEQKRQQREQMSSSSSSSSSWFSFLQSNRGGTPQVTTTSISASTTALPPNTQISSSPASPATQTLSPTLQNGPEAEALRTEVALRVRDQILKLRREVLLADAHDADLIRGRHHAHLAEDEDPRYGLARTWAREPSDRHRFRSNVDDSDVNKKST